MAWLYTYDAKLKLPYQDNLSALIHEPSFKAVAGETVFNKARVIQRQSNDAVHSTRPVRQYDALQVITEHLPDSSPVNLVTEKQGEGRVFLSTYPTMMGLIDEARDGERRFGPGHFDLIVIDEAHRPVFQKYRSIFG